MEMNQSQKLAVSINQQPITMYNWLIIFIKYGMSNVMQKLTVDVDYVYYTSVK